MKKQAGENNDAMVRHSIGEYVVISTDAIFQCNDKVGDVVGA